MDLEMSSSMREWTRSSFCADGTCVEVAPDNGNRIRMRDSKNPEGLVLSFTQREWKVFLDCLVADRGESR